MRTTPLSSFLSLFTGERRIRPREEMAHGRPFASHCIATGDSYAMCGMAACLPTRIGSSVSTSDIWDRKCRGRKNEKKAGNTMPSRKIANIDFRDRSIVANIFRKTNWPIYTVFSCASATCRSKHSKTIKAVRDLTWGKTLDPIFFNLM